MSSSNKDGKLKEILKIYRWPIVGLIVWGGLASWKFGSDFWSGLGATLIDEKWWIDNAASFIIFSLLVSWLVVAAQRNRARLEQEKYEGWKLHIKGLQEKAEPQKIYWEDVRRIEVSDFELWKFVKSAVSNMCWIKTRTIDDARDNGWLQIQNSEREITINFSKMSEDDIQVWSCDCPTEWIKNPDFKEPDVKSLQFIRKTLGTREQA